MIAQKRLLREQFVDAQQGTFTGDPVVLREEMRRARAWEGGLATEQGYPLLDYRLSGGNVEEGDYGKKGVPKVPKGGVSWITQGAVEPVGETDDVFFGEKLRSWGPVREGILSEGVIRCGDAAKVALKWNADWKPKQTAVSAVDMVYGLDRQGSKDGKLGLWALDPFTTMPPGDLIGEHDTWDVLEKKLEPPQFAAELEKTKWWKSMQSHVGEAGREKNVACKALASEGLLLGYRGVFDSRESGDVGRGVAAALVKAVAPLDNQRTPQVEAIANRLEEAYCKDIPAVAMAYAASLKTSGSGLVVTNGPTWADEVGVTEDE
ncbi:hypothetical protein [Pseudogulbenkiania ferrooxidans]|nr:hypothetical protein [Pseudogulbenkiania ferrooxidans]